MNLAPPPHGNGFAERLEWLLDGRPPTPWAARVGMGGGSIGRITADPTARPSAKVLSRIGLTENVSINWLLDGQGAPFHVIRTGSQHETIAALDAELEERGWNLVLMHADRGSAVVLFLPVEMDIDKGEPLRYVSVRVIAGPIGEGVHERLIDDALRPAAIINADPAHMFALYSGWLGTWRLFGDEDNPGLIDLSAPALSPDWDLRVQWMTHGVAEQAPIWPDVPPVDELWMRMTEDERQALHLVLTPFLQSVRERRR